jgi:hypothetical protein
LFQPVNGGDEGQRFKIIPRSTPGEYHLINCRGGKVLGTVGALHHDGAEIHTWHHGHTRDQDVKIDHLDGRPTQIVFLHSNKALDVDGGKTDNGAKLQQWTFDVNSRNQKFRILPAGATSYKFDASHEFRIRSVHSGKYLEVEHAKDNHGAPLVQNHSTGVTNQKFKLIEKGTDLYSIQSVPTGLILACPDGNNGARLVLADGKGAPNEVFHILKVNGQPTQIVPQHAPNKVLDLLSWEKKDNAPVAIWDNGSAQANQIWVFERVIGY